MQEGFFLLRRLVNRRFEKSLVDKGEREDGICAGAYKELPECYETFPCYDYTDKLIIPGFADLHVILF